MSGHLTKNSQFCQLSWDEIGDLRVDSNSGLAVMEITIPSTSDKKVSSYALGVEDMFIQSKSLF